MVSELGRLALARGSKAVRIETEVTSHNLPVRQFLATRRRDDTSGTATHESGQAAAIQFQQVKTDRARAQILARCQQQFDNARGSERRARSV